MPSPARGGNYRRSVSVPWRRRRDLKDERMKPPRPPVGKVRIEKEASPAGPSPSDAGERHATPYALSGPISRVDAPVSEESCAEARALLTTVFADYEARRKKWREEPPPKEQDSNIPIGRKEKRIKLDDLLTKALSEVGCLRIDKLTYRAEWNTPEVEHILAFDTYGTPKIFLTGEVGLRNVETEAFAVQCEQRYANPIIRDSAYVFPRGGAPCTFRRDHWRTGKAPISIRRNIRKPNLPARLFTPFPILSCTMSAASRRASACWIFWGGVRNRCAGFASAATFAPRR